MVESPHPPRESMFMLSEHDRRLIDAWDGGHPCAHRIAAAEEAKACNNDGAPVDGAFGGRIKYIFTPTSVGMWLDVVCSCGAVFEDVSDLTRNW